MTSGINKQSIDLNKLTFSEYGKGYLAKPPSGFKFNDKLKYFHGGWWMPSQEQWFFKKSDYTKLKTLMKSDKHPKKSTVVDDVDRLLTPRNNTPLKDYQYRKYKGGFLLFIREDRIGEVSFPDDYKYFHDTWWMDSQNAWFFRSDMLSSIRNKGATEYMAMEEEMTMEEETTMEEEMTMDKEMTMDDLDQDSDSDYVPESDSESEDTELDEPVEINCDQFKKWVTWEKYGRGWLVRPKSRNFQLYGEKYLNGGWWMPKHEGWFFKNNTFKQLGLK